MSKQKTLCYVPFSDRFTVFKKKKKNIFELNYVTSSVLYKRCAISLYRLSSSSVLFADRLVPREEKCQTISTSNQYHALHYIPGEYYLSYRDQKRIQSLSLSLFQLQIHSLFMLTAEHPPLTVIGC